MERSDIVAEVLKSKKYRGIDTSVIQRICADTAARYPKKKEALKAAKSELHSIHQSFLQYECHQTASALLTALPPDYSETQLDDMVMQLMRLHASTRERLAEIRAIYSFIGQHITAESTVMDIGCGFNPFALPLLREQAKAYVAYDINTETIDVLNAFFARTQSPLYKASIFDVVSATPGMTADVVLLLKLLPLLQQQKKGRGFELLTELRFQKAIVSFPLKSLTGKQKGMGTFYSAWMEDGLPSTLQTVHKRSFASEVFYIVVPSAPI